MKQKHVSTLGISVVILLAIVVAACRCKHERLSLPQLTQSFRDWRTFGVDGRFMYCLDCGAKIKFKGSDAQSSQVIPPSDYSENDCSFV